MLCRDVQRSTDDGPSGNGTSRLFTEKERDALQVVSDAKLSVQERLERADRMNQLQQQQQQGGSNGAQLQQDGQQPQPSSSSSTQLQQRQQEEVQLQEQDSDSNVPFPIWCAAGLALVLSACRFLARCYLA